MVRELVATRYELQDRIGTGGAAVVYRAHDRRLDRTVALKVLRDELAGDPEFVARFEREARAAARISHPNVVHVHDYGAHGDTAFIAMEYIDGESLKDRLRRIGRFEVGEALRIARAVLAGLSVAHAGGLVHRDVKPQNVLLGRDGTIKLVDFGIAQTAALAGLTQTGTTMGTASYMAPEQVQGAPTGPATDLYGLGAVLYEMLTGRPPFEGESPIEVAFHHLNDPPRPPGELVDGIPAGVEAAVMRALAKEPSERFSSAQTMLVALGGDPVAGTASATTRMAALAPETTALMPSVRSAGATAAMPEAAGVPARRRGAARGDRATDAAVGTAGSLVRAEPWWRRWLVGRRRVPLAAGALALLVLGLVAAGGLPELRFRRSAATTNAVLATVVSTPPGPGSGSPPLEIATVTPSGGAIPGWVLRAVPTLDPTATFAPSPSPADAPTAPTPLPQAAVQTRSQPVQSAAPTPSPAASPSTAPTQAPATPARAPTQGAATSTPAPTQAAAPPPPAVPSPTRQPAPTGTAPPRAPPTPTPAPR